LDSQEPKTGTKKRLESWGNGGDGGKLQPSDRPSSPQASTPQLLGLSLLALTHGIAFAAQDENLFGSNVDAELTPLVRHP
jgi:hypothetical protein